jgi:NAD(P) transhydrogenase subunit alpha
MKPGSVIVDLAASELGGNVEGSAPYQTTVVNGVKVIGAPDLASRTAKAASNLLARNLTDVALHFVEVIGDDAVLKVDIKNELTKAILITQPAVGSNADANTHTPELESGLEVDTGVSIELKQLDGEEDVQVEGENK